MAEVFDLGLDLLLHSLCLVTTYSPTGAVARMQHHLKIHHTLQHSEQLQNRTVSTEIPVLRAKVDTCGGANSVEQRAGTNSFFFKITLFMCFQHLKVDKIHLS